MDIKIVTDSSCDLPEELVEKCGIDVVSLHVTFENNETFTERVTISPEQFWERMAGSRELPKTSRPTPEAFADTFRKALANYASVIYIGLSSSLSGTFESAQLAAKSVPGDIHLIDSLSGSLGLGILAIKAHEFIHSGINVQAVVNKVINYRDGMTTLFTMDSLENLIKGGRVGRLPGFIGTVLSIRPIGKAGDRGQIDVLEKVRGRGKSLQRIVQLVGEMGSNLKEKIVGISHVNCLKEALNLKKSIEENFQPGKVIISKVGSTMGTYAGTGGIIVSF
ncbi:DegV family protein [Pelotomaculum propionicicum]|uniref:DegV domain-containing protein n=1 Tax=Pelotomaculum propionicicum TaxID=258475 RepID=A0A4Y7RPS9_9FIRM|nr:DegV family protein [Pelotomaculum propionicicum]NLI13904.1 DegV family protein [Peptococcaceae bacterium]TEB11024.1 DegV domain-containing protein [Pelotomaculum propionicicum]